MHRLKNMKETLVNCVQAQLADIKNVNTEELGEAIDMIKDLEEAMYYCSIVKAMEKQEEEEHSMRKHYIPYDRDMDREMGRMYYPRKSMNVRPNYYHEQEFPTEWRDSREGRSPMSRRMYMESKEMHKDKTEKVKELEKYMQELSEDIVEMIDGASPEERAMLEKKMTHLTSKISQLN